MSYSQNNEETVILQQFPGVTDGHFLDIGAYTGKELSNTLRLAELGWTGVCVEASPFVFPKLVETHRGNPKIALVNAAITPESLPYISKWYDSEGDGVSTNVESHKAKWEAGSQVKFTPFYVSMLPLTILFEEFGHIYDFVNIDVESTNIDVFRALPKFLWENVKVLCVEHDGYIPEMTATADRHGFKVMLTNGENLIFARK